MGAYLRRWYGDGYRPISLLTWDGAYSATVSFTDHRIIEAVAFPGPPNSLEGALHSLRRPAGSSGFIVNLRGALDTPGGAGSACRDRSGTWGTQRTTMDSS